MAAIARRFDERRLTGPSLYSRILALPESGEIVPQPELRNEHLLTAGLEPYESALRNQIRQAVRHELNVTITLPTEASEIRHAYRDFVPLHRVSWDRTGMQPHDERYWETLSQAVLSGGGRDVIVYVRDQADRAIAAAVCHVRNERALYWAGCSNEEGLRTRANPLCLHAAIQACRQIGVRRFELGRFNAREPSDKERSVTRYKAQFGGELVRIVGFETGVPLAAILRRRVAALRLRHS
jgi:Acetyltransferase (GNAT) domain